VRKGRKLWRHVEGRRPHRVVVRERKLEGSLYIGIWDPTLRNGNGDTRWESLGHSDRAAAKIEAAEEHAKLVRGEADARVGRLTWARLFALYLERRTPQKTARTQADDHRRVEAFTRFLHRDQEVTRITRARWEEFIALRRSGAIDARGNVVSKEDRHPVRDRVLEADLRWLLAVLNWATTWQDSAGRYLLVANPARGFEVPREVNPRRPVAMRERYEALRAVSDQVMMEIGRGKRRRAVRSYLSEMLDLAVWTGRRLSAIRCLRYSDLNLERTAATPFGAITWPAETDKEGILWKDVQLYLGAREAIDRILRERPGKGDDYLFPAPRDASQPVSRNLPDKWLREAERMAGLKPQNGSLWHAFRRMAAMEHKGLPVKDVMRLLGWSDRRSLDRCYEHADTATTLDVMAQRRPLREVAQ
jgi:integrase